jgi:hypothetical protein
MDTNYLIAQSGDPAGVDLGRAMGRREAFASVAGICSAAEAENLRRIRNEKSYLQLGLTWEEFCVVRLRSSRRQVERVIGLLEEFGPRYFQMAQCKHLTAEEYRAIAGDVSDEGVRLDNALIPLLPENSEQVSAAVDVLIERKKPVKRDPVVTLASLLKRCDALTESLERMAGGRLAPLDALKLSFSINRLRGAASEKGATT